MKNTSHSSIVSISLLSLLVLGLQWLRINFLAPPPEYIWDNVYLWDWARNFGHGDFSNFVNDSHHQLRWGNWGFAAVMIKVFSDDILIYYLSTIIPSTIAILIFVYLAWRHVGWQAATVFIVLWFFDALLFRATFQLLPSGSALLPLAILVSLLLNLQRSGLASLTWQILTAATIFWLYGTKETHLAYLPGVLWLIYRVVGLRPIVTIMGLCVIGYVLETLMFLAISPEFTWLGRVYAVINDGQHVQLMTEETRYVDQQTRFFDSGITMRWVLTSGVTPVAIFLGYVLAVLSQMKTRSSSEAGDKLATPDKEETRFFNVVSVLIFSFMICTTFFIIQFDPIRLGHPLVPRYVTTLMPLIYLMIVAYLRVHTRHANWTSKVALLVTLPFFIAPGIDRYSEYRKLSIFRISEDYQTFSKSLNDYQCVRAKQRVILMNQLDMVLERYRSPRLNRLIEADMTSEKPQEPQIVYREPWYIATPNANKACTSMYTIYRNTTMRY